MKIVTTPVTRRVNRSATNPLTDIGFMIGISQTAGVIIFLVSMICVELSVI